MDAVGVVVNIVGGVKSRRDRRVVVVLAETRKHARVARVKVDVARAHVRRVALGARAVPRRARRKRPGAAEDTKAAASAAASASADARSRSDGVKVRRNLVGNVGEDLGIDQDLDLAVALLIGRLQVHLEPVVLVDQNLLLLRQAVDVALKVVDVGLELFDLQELVVVVVLDVLVRGLLRLDEVVRELVEADIHLPVDDLVRLVLDVKEFELAPEVLAAVQDRLGNVLKLLKRAVAVVNAAIAVAAEAESTAQVVNLRVKDILRRLGLRHLRVGIGSAGTVRTMSEPCQNHVRTMSERQNQVEPSQKQVRTKLMPTLACECLRAHISVKAPNFGPQTKGVIHHDIVHAPRTFFFDFEDFR